MKKNFYEITDGNGMTKEEYIKFQKENPRLYKKLIKQRKKAQEILDKRRIKK